MNIRMYPRVFRDSEAQTVYFSIEDTILDPSLLKVRFIPMEHYNIPHKDYHINEIYRYPLLDVYCELGVVAHL